MGQKIMQFSKQQGWETRLSSVIEYYQEVEFIWGKTDCFLFVGDCIKAITNIDLMSRARGTYDSNETAKKELKANLRGELKRAWYKIASELENCREAQRGDIGLITLGGKEQYCGVVFDNVLFIRTKNGLMRKNIKQNNIQLWRIK